MVVFHYLVLYGIFKNTMKFKAEFKAKMKAMQVMSGI